MIPMLKEVDATMWQETWRLLSHTQHNRGNVDCVNDAQ